MVQFFAPTDPLPQVEQLVHLNKMAMDFLGSVPTHLQSTPFETTFFHVKRPEKTLGENLFKIPNIYHKNQPFHVDIW